MKYLQTSLVADVIIWWFLYRVCKNQYSDIFTEYHSNNCSGYWLLLVSLASFFKSHKNLNIWPTRWCHRNVWWCSVKLNFLFSFDIRHPIQDEVAETDQERLKPLQNNPPLPFVSRDRILLDHRTKMEKYFMLWYKVGFWLGSSRDRQKTLWGNFFYLVSRSLCI